MAFGRYILPVLAILGILFALFMIYLGSRKPPVPRVIFAPARSPYQHAIAAQGVVESAYRDIYVAVSFADLITDVYIKVGDIVKKGDPLLKTDTRQFEAQLKEAMEQLEQAKIEYENKKIQYSFYERVKDTAAVSESDMQAAFYAMEVAKQQIEVAQAQVNVIATNIERSVAVAPIDGEVLQVLARVGEYANINPYTQQPLMIFGDTSVYHLRIDIDEEDAWRIIKGAPARAYARGNGKINFPLEWVYFEPYAIPKKTLSGSDFQRVDTRVVQLVYKFPRNKYPVFAGQLLDVFVEANPINAPLDKLQVLDMHQVEKKCTCGAQI